MSNRLEPTYSNPRHNCAHLAWRVGELVGHSDDVLRVVRDAVRDGYTDSPADVQDLARLVRETRADTGR